MKMMIVAGLVITLPAIVVLLFDLNKTVAISAAASLAVNSIPFIVAGLLLRKGDGSDAESH
jgi:hypothetical protein